MRFLRHLAFASVVAAGTLAPLGCGSTPESQVEAVVKTSGVGKKAVVKYVKTKRFLFTPKGEIRPSGNLTGYTGVIKAEDTKEGVDYSLIRMERDEYWVKSDDIVHFDEASAYFDKLLDESPKAYEPRVLRATVQMDSGHPEKALEDLGEAHRLKPNVHYPLTVRAKAYEMLGEYTKAFNDYDTVLKFDTNNLMVFLGRADVLNKLGRTDSALIDLDRAIKFDPRCVSAYLLRSSIWEQKKEDLAALQEFDRASAVDSNDPEINAARGGYWFRKKAFAKANDEFDAALKKDSEHVKALTGKSLVLSLGTDAKERDPKRAVDLATKACDLSGWKNALAIDALATAHAANGNFTEAGKYVRQALDDPQFAKVNGETAKKRIALFQNNLPYAME